MFFVSIQGFLIKHACVPRIEDANRIPEYIARAYATAISGRPGPVVLALPEDMLADATDARPRPRVERPAQAPCPDAMQAMMAMIGDAAAPIAVIGGRLMPPPPRAGPASD